MKHIIEHIRKSIEIVIIIISILLCMSSIVVPVSANSIFYGQSHHSYKGFHNNIVEQEDIPKITTGIFVVRQNVIVSSGNIFFGVSNSVAANTGTTVFRAVNAAEASSVKATGQFLPQLARMFGRAGGARLHRVPFFTVVCNDICAARIFL